MLMAAMSSRKAAEIEVPMTPPTLCIAGNAPLIADDAIAIAIDSATTTLECPNEK